MSTPDPAARTGETTLQLVKKAAELLGVLADEGEVTAADLADRTGEPRSSIYRLLHTLVDLDLVESGSRRGAYRLGIGLLRLGSAVVAQMDEARYAYPTMERLHRATGETVFLCIRRGFDAVCIVRLDGRRVQSMELRVGGSQPLHMGAAPRALLAFQSRDFWAAYVMQPNLEPLSPNTIVTADSLYPVLDEVRRTGVSVSDGDVTPGIAALGVPIFDYRENVRASLSISGVRPAILGSGSEQMRDLLVTAGQEVSASLGYQRAGPIVASLG